MAKTKLYRVGFRLTSDGTVLVRAHNKAEAREIIEELDFSELDEHAGVLDEDNTVAIREVALTIAENESWDPDFSCEPEEDDEGEDA